MTAPADPLIGRQLGTYLITARIGSGGMGEVYGARDTRLQRDVAIKVLPAAFARDPDRIDRLQREAIALASLNHRNIAIIHGLEEADGIRALVLELIEGPTLADRIARGPMPLDEALGIARQIADALQTAHDRGVIHRDLKPANIKVRRDGTVKVLDFGLAKLLDSQPTDAALADSPTTKRSFCLLSDEIKKILAVIVYLFRCYLIKCGISLFLLSRSGPGYSCQRLL